MLNTADIQRKLTIASAKKEEATATVQRLKKELETANSDLLLARDFCKLVQEASQLTLETISLNINKIVNNAIKAVFGAKYEFSLGFDIKYNKLSCSMVLTDSKSAYDIRNQVGDGICDCVALALRVAVLCLDRHHYRRVLFLDEPAGAVSVGYQPMIGKLIETLSEQLHIQIFIIAAHGADYQFSSAKCFNSADFTAGANL